MHLIGQGGKVDLGTAGWSEAGSCLAHQLGFHTSSFFMTFKGEEEKAGFPRKNCCLRLIPSSLVGEQLRSVELDAAAFPVQLY